VIDTVAQASPGGDENAPETMGLIVNAGQRIRDRFRCCVVLVHHAGKDKGRGARGHSSLRAAADVEIEIVETHGQRVARVTKSRDGESGAEIAFSLRQIVIGKDEDGDDITTCVVEPSREAPNAKGSTAKLPPAASIALDALREVGGTKGRRSTETSTTPAGKTIVNLDDWRDQFRLRYGTDGQDGEAIKKAFQRARERLAGDKVIGVSGSVAWLW